MSGTFTSLVNETLEVELTRSGWTRPNKKYGIFTLLQRQHPDFIGWCGANTAHSDGGEAVAINFVVGVHCRSIAALLEEAAGWPRPVVIQPTVSAHINYLRPNNKQFIPTKFSKGQDLRPPTLELLRNLNHYGLPFVALNSTLDGVLSSLQDPGLRPIVAPDYKIAACLFLLGMRQELTELMTTAEQMTVRDGYEICLSDFCGTLLKRLMS